MKCKHNTLTLPCIRAVYSRVFELPTRSFTRSFVRCWVSLMKKNVGLKLSESLILSENVPRMHFITASDVLRALLKRMRFVSNRNSRSKEWECGRVTKKWLDASCRISTWLCDVRWMNELLSLFCFSFLHSWPCAFANTSVWIYTCMAYVWVDL